MNTQCELHKKKYIETSVVEADTIKLELPASHKYLNVLGGCISEMLSRVECLHDGDSVIYNVQLAVHECCANIVDHAYGGTGQGRITVHAAFLIEPRLFIAEVYDTGISFDMSAAPVPDLEAGQVHGYGLFLMHQLLDDVIYTPGDGINKWTLIKRL